MFGGTWVRIGWPLARKVYASSLMEDDELSWKRPVFGRALFLRMIGAMGESFEEPVLALDLR